MEYDESPERSGEITRMVLPALAKMGLSVNPINYSLLYEYYLGNNEPLRNILDPYIELKEDLEPKQAKQIFEDHIVHGQSDQLKKLSDEIRELIATVLNLISNAGGEGEKFNGSLEAYKGQLEQVETIQEAAEIKNLVHSMIDEAREMLDSNKRFSQQLDTTSREIGLLRAEMQDLRLQASLDSLTGLGNRKTFDESLSRALDSAPDDMSSVCLMMVDIDNFKRINDEYGHLIGDKILRFIADILKRSVKGRDTVSRFGGDEFGVVLEETPPSGAYRLAESIRQTVAKSALKRTDTGEPIGSITVSIGVDCNQNGDDVEDLLHRADKALYESKQKGRNRVTCTMKRPTFS
jgi:diguanylate cyclase